MNLSRTSYIQYAQNRSGQLNIADVSYGRRGNGAVIAFTIVPWQLAPLLIGGTARGACWIGIHESAAHLESELRRDFPEARIVRDNSAMGELTADIMAFLDRKQAALHLPVDIRATPFQLAVWRELLTIPPGTTRSYNEIARRIRQSGAARAVGRANGSNPLAVLIPCHRAVGAGGKLTGYRWGLDYKRRLLNYERTALPNEREAAPGVSR